LRPLVQIIDAGIGNINSVKNMFAKIGADIHVCTKPENIITNERLILPGVGAFDEGCTALKAQGWLDILNDEVMERKTPILGICLGMQLLFEGSDEGIQSGLGWLKGNSRKFKFSKGSPFKIPHMGWNTVTIVNDNVLFPVDFEELRFYFLHSYHVDCKNKEDIIALTNHGSSVTAAVNRNNIYGVQFHPEKSHRFGYSIFQKFINL